MPEVINVPEPNFIKLPDVTAAATNYGTVVSSTDFIATASVSTTSSAPAAPMDQTEFVEAALVGVPPSL